MTLGQIMVKPSGELRKAAHLTIAVLLFIGCTALAAWVPAFGPYYGTALTFIGAIMATGLGVHVADKKLVDGAAKVAGAVERTIK